MEVSAWSTEESERDWRPGRTRTAGDSKPPEDTGGLLHLSLVPVEKGNHLAEFLIVGLGEDEDSVLLELWSGEEYFLQKLRETCEQGQVASK